MTFCARKSGGLLRSANKNTANVFRRVYKRYQKRLFIMQHDVVSALYAHHTNIDCTRHELYTRFYLIYFFH